jgi:hypothetical protein
MIQTAGDSKLPELEDGVTATVNFRGRFMVPSGKEYQCSITEMSTREVFLSSCEKPEVGQKIIVYAHEVGRFVGIVERHQDSSFSARLDLANVKKRASRNGSLGTSPTGGTAGLNGPNTHASSPCGK